MSYLSMTFAAFVLVLLVLYYLLPRKACVRGALLLCASVVFYALFDLRYVLFLLFVALSTFGTAWLKEKCEGKKWILILCIAVNAAVWFVIKMLPWTWTTAGRVLTKVGVTIPGTIGTIIVPVGISYYILQAIAYLADVYKSKIPAEKQFWKYLLFLSWFPTIVQGPISRYSQLMPQLLNERKFSFDKVRDAGLLLLFGLVKKMVIADRLGIFVNACFGEFESLRGIVLYLAAVGYAIQLYTDFSGCVDICRGVSGLFGVELVSNFNRPYQSGSIKEFWGKWHMSLSGWLKDYVYIPLGGNRKGTLRKYVNLLCTFLVSGLWHGAGFNYILWGVMHAVYQITGQATQNIRTKVKKWIGVESGSASERIYQVLITFHLVLLGWIVFRAGGLMSGVNYICNMLREAQLWVLFDGSLFEFSVNKNYFILLLLHIVGLFAVEMRTKQQQDVIAGVTGLHVVLRWTVYLVLIFDVLLFGVYGSGYDMASFMYGGF